MRRLSEKRPRRQVERELVSLGATIRPRDKPRATRRKSKKAKDVISDNDEENEAGSHHSENSDAELELDEPSVRVTDDVDKENTNPSVMFGESPKAADEERMITTPITDEKLNEEPAIDVMVKSSHKRKRVVASSDEEDDTPLEESKEKTPEPEESSKSPLSLKKKKHRVIVSDSDDE
ncbi:unnamed protein product [Cylicostephanus goldi]|uniref:Uncharacterized protein n=1 Tax=Cylicostephanus goldi TaxID=71465 RepID=A0A3P7QHV4_CYLGO|nr:unnamed protein product [Cylicostephanus goldi]